MVARLVGRWWRGRAEVELRVELWVHLRAGWAEGGGGAAEERADCWGAGGHVGLVCWDCFCD